MDLTYKDIIDNSFVDHTKQTLTNGEKLTYYINQTTGWADLVRYPVMQFTIIKADDIRIYNINHSQLMKDFIRLTFNKLDEIIDLDFQEMSTNNGSMLDIYQVNYSSIFSENVIGQAISQRSNVGSWWEILWKDSALIGNTDIDSNLNTIVHELGHTLGLSHPFNDPSNPSFDSKDTVMSYNKSIDGWDSWFSNTDLNALISIWGREDDNGIINFPKNSYDYKFKRSGQDSYFINTEIKLEDISHISSLQFKDKSLSVQTDIIDVFNLVKDKDDITGKIYRLYNAAFGRFPDKAGLSYWINKNQSGIDSYRQTASSFIISNEFKNLYGLESTNEEYITTLYSNILNRSPDINGYKYWQNQLNQGLENRSELLMGFSESLENKGIFYNETNLS